MARTPRMARGKIFLAQGMHCCPKFMCLLPYNRHHNIVHNVCMYTHLTTYRLYMNYRCYQITRQGNILTQITNRAKC
jgi:hypothetical protein